MNWLPKFDRPFIALDFDGTISVNGFAVSGRAQEMIHYLENTLGYLTVVITGRTVAMPHIIKHPRVVCMHINPERDKYVENFNPIRFKLWALRSYYDNGRGHLLFYVDNDQVVVNVCRSANIPVVSLGGAKGRNWTETMKYWIGFFTKDKQKINKGMS